jgi:hypothetical protein
MKKFLLRGLSLAIALAIPSALMAESVAHGYQMGDKNNKFGFISFKVSEFASPTMDKVNYDDYHVSAGECVNGIYYTYEVYPDVMGGVSAYCYKVRDAKTFEILKTVLYYDDTQRVVDMTYDYTTNTMYGLVEDAVNTSTLSASSLCVIDLETGDWHKVGSPGNLKAINGNGKEVDEALVTLAADASGNLYAMGEYRQFYKLNKLTGAAQQIGSQHSIATMNQFQSMAFDTEGVLYWAQCHPDYGYFLTIDPATGVPSYMAEDTNLDTKYENEASKLGDDAEVTGLYFEKALDSTAPAMVSNLSAALKKGTSNNVVINWTLPTVDLAGDEVNITAVKVFRFGESDAIATLAGDATSYEDVAPNGEMSYMIAAISGEKQGRPAVASVLAGADMLCPVSDLHASIEGSKVTVTWKAPTATYNGGYTDYDNISYIVWRIKGTDEAIIARDVKETSYVDELTVSGTYYYSVVPVSCGVEGYACDSETVTLEQQASIPYSTGFEDDGDGSLWSFENAEHSNASYGWSRQLGYAYQRYDGKYVQLKTGGTSDVCDDYMFSPAIEFQPGTYQLSYLVNGSVSSDTHSWSAYLADGASSSANHIVEIESHENEAVSSSWIENKATFTVKEAGTYRLAFHGNTTCAYATLKIDNLSIEAAPKELPYTCDFEGETDADDWTIINSNPEVARGCGWSIYTDKNSPNGPNVARFYTYGSSTLPFDDWMISPALEFPSEGTYKISYKANGASYDTHTWSIRLGKDMNGSESFTQVIASFEKTKFPSWSETYEHEFQVSEAGKYYIAFNGIGDSTYASLKIDNIMVMGKTDAVRSVNSDARGAFIDAAGNVIADSQIKSVDVYNTQGARVARLLGVGRVNVPAGLYIVVIRLADGSEITHKYLRR